MIDTLGILVGILAWILFLVLPVLSVAWVFLTWTGIDRDEDGQLKVFPREEEENP